MSEQDAISRCDAALDAFERDTGIWPPGRSMPNSFGGGEDADTIRFKAWIYWRRAHAACNAHDALLAACEDALACVSIAFQDCCNPEACEFMTAVEGDLLAAIRLARGEEVPHE